jgi:hypothetical protein
MCAAYRYAQAPSPSAGAPGYGPSWSCGLADDGLPENRLTASAPHHSYAGGGLDTRPLAQVGSRRHRDRAVDAPQGLEGLGHRREAPGWPLVAEGVFETRHACRLCGDGLHVCLHDHGRRRVGPTTSLRQRQGAGRPWAWPVSRLSCRRQKALSRPWATVRFRRASSRARLRARIAASSTAGTSTGGQLPGAHEPGPWPGVMPVGFDPVARLVGNHGGSADPADGALCRQIARAPVAAGAGVVDHDEGLALRGQLPHEPIEVTLAGADLPRDTTSAPDSCATEATAIDSCCTSMPTDSVFDCCMAALRGCGMPVGDRRRGWCR